MPAKAKILVVDDTEENIRQLSLNLAARRYSVLPARSGKEAYAMAARESPDIIILDVEMPGGMDGFETLKKLRSNDATRRIPVIMLTKRQGQQDEKAGLEEGVVDYIKRPLDMEVLHLRIRNALKYLRPYTSDGSSRLSLYAVNGHRIDAEATGKITSKVLGTDTFSINVAAYADAAQPNAPNWRIRVREKGYLLYSQMIASPGNIYGLYAALKPDEENLQIRVRQLGEGLRVPIEYLYDRKDGVGGGEYLVLHHPFARTILDYPVRRKPINRNFLNEIFDEDGELRVLLIASNTEPNIPGVDIEVEELESLIRDAFAKKRIEVSIKKLSTDEANYKVVRDELRACKYHIIHYAGHGLFDQEKPEESALYFWENGVGSEIKRMPATELNMLLGGSQAAFIYFSCCEGAAAGSTDTLAHGDFLGVTESVVRAGVPAVLGYRWPVSDLRALEMAREFYTALAVSGEIDCALLKARQSIAGPHRDDSAWLSPVLFMQD
jgi:DNA-binding response OmpR family regulator